MVELRSKVIISCVTVCVEVYHADGTILGLRLGLGRDGPF